MADILISGMALPTEEEEARLVIIYHDGRIISMNHDESKAIEVPDHGRLIDADALINNLIEELKYCCEGGHAEQRKRETIVRLDTTPTVIPASWEG